MALAHVAMRTDAARDAKTCPFGKFLANTRDIAGGFEGRTERCDSKLFQSRQLLATQRQQLTFGLFHARERF